jgi:Periplasmic protein involved in polysaccharide export
MHLPSSTPQRFLYALIACLTGCWLLVSCITYKDVNYLQKPNQDVTRYKDSVRFEEYKLQPGDRLSIMVYSLNEETNRLFQGSSESADGGSGGMASGDLFTYKIDEKGVLTFPYVGQLEATGKTLRGVKDELEERIKTQFGNCYIRVNMANAYFSVIGEGGNGRYPLVKDKLNIFEALAISGDLGSFANRKQVKILRQTLHGTVVKTFDVRSRDIMHTEFYYLQPNDVIYVQKTPSHFFGVTSWSALLGTISTTISLLLLGISISKHF